MRSFFREPLNIALLIVLPALSIQIFGIGYGQFSGVGFLNTPASLETTARITGAVFATGALAGVLGLFQIISAREADRRLSICGYPAVDLLASRLTALAAISFAIAGISTVTLEVLLDVPMRAPVLVFAGLSIGGLIYAALGMLVGAALPRELEGSLVLVIFADMDNVLASGIFQIEESITRFSPLSYPHDIVTRAVTRGELAGGKLLPAFTFVLAFGVLAVLSYRYTVEPVESGVTSR
jgi:ABC-2 type transport system permease protein